MLGQGGRLVLSHKSVGIGPRQPLQPSSLTPYSPSTTYPISVVICSVQKKYSEVVFLFIQGMVTLEATL